MRAITITQLKKNTIAELRNLPVAITYYGNIIAIVITPTTNISQILTESLSVVLTEDCKRLVQ